MLIAGATGSGKGSVIWSLIRALLPAIAAGWVQVWALDPKRMELSFGRALFHRYACHAAAMVELLEAAVAEMHDRAGQFGGRTRTFTPSTGFPFVVVLVDELAFLTAYQPERDLRKRAEAAIATLTSQGRSVGVCVVGALQDPRKDVISLRNLFSTRIALRLDESDQVDMVLGDGARDRGALADQISPLPYTGAGVGYVRLEASPDPVRVRAAYVTDADIWPWPMRSATCPAVAYEGNRLAHRRTLPRLRHRAGPGRHRRAGAAGRMPPVRLRRAVRHRRHRLGRCLVTAGRTTRAERMAVPLARQVVKDLAAEHGACLRPVQLRRTEIDTGHVEQVLIPCGHTLASVCPSCAERARILRAAQCREGWHLDHEPVIDPDPATEDQRALVTDRAETQEGRDLLASEGLDTDELDERIGELDEADHRCRAPRPGAACAAAPPPLDPAQAGRRSAPPPHGQPPDGRQDLHRAGRQDLPALAVRHADVPVVRPGRRGRSTRRPGHLRLHPRRPRRAALRRAVRPVHPEPAPLHRL